jgi:hypothetical protein
VLKVRMTLNVERSLLSGLAPNQKISILKNIHETSKIKSGEYENISERKKMKFPFVKPLLVACVIIHQTNGFSQNMQPATPLLRPPPAAAQETVKLRIFKVEASSSQGAAVPMKVIDGKLQNVYSGPGSQGWISRRGETLGSWIELYLDQQCVVTELALYMGNGDGYHDQVRKATVTVAEGVSNGIQFQSTSGWQRVPIGSGKTEKVRLRVDELFPATRPRDQVGIYELELYGHSCS